MLNHLIQRAENHDSNDLEVLSQLTLAIPRASNSQSVANGYGISRKLEM